jgi:hypothetical protein
MDSPAFTAPCVFINTQANNVTSTKQAVDGTTDLIAAASGAGRIFSNIIDLGDPSEPPPEPTLLTETSQAHRAPGTPRSTLVQGAPVANYGVIWNGRLSRSTTPNDDAQWRWLRAQGVNTIVNLDRKSSDYGKFGFENFLWIPLDNGAPSTSIDAERFLKFVQEPDNQPVHILSAEADERIATMAALTSYAVDGQTIEAALVGARIHNEGRELSPTQMEWLRSWAMHHQPGSHRRK